MDLFVKFYSFKEKTPFNGEAIVLYDKNKSIIKWGAKIQYILYLMDILDNGRVYFNISEPFSRENVLNDAFILEDEESECFAWKLYYVIDWVFDDEISYKFPADNVDDNFFWAPIECSMVNN